MKNKIKSLISKEKARIGEMRRKRVKEETVSQKEILKECRLELSMSDYRELARLAMQAGCTPEELVARRIAQMLR